MGHGVGLSCPRGVSRGSSGSPGGEGSGRKRGARHVCVLCHPKWSLWTLHHEDLRSEEAVCVSSEWGGSHGANGKRGGRALSTGASEQKETPFVDDPKEENQTSQYA